MVDIVEAVDGEENIPVEALCSYAPRVGRRNYQEERKEESIAFRRTQSKSMPGIMPTPNSPQNHSLDVSLDVPLASLLTSPRRPLDVCLHVPSTSLFTPHTVPAYDPPTLKLLLRCAPGPGS